MHDPHPFDDMTDEEPAKAGPDVDNLEPYGMGYRWQWRTGRTWVRMTFRSMRKVSSGLSAEVTVEAGVPAHGIKGVLTVERVPLGNGRDRASLAKRLEDRTGEDQINWRDLLDSVCSRILRAQQAGPAIQTIGTNDEKGVNWLIDGLVEEHQTTSIYGDGEVGKSWQALAACVSLASGIEIVSGWRPVRRGRPIYLDWETDQETLNTRVRMICRGAGIPYVPIQYVACDGPLSDQVEWLLERVQDDGLDLIVVDSVEAAMAGSRGEGGDIHEPAAKVNQVLRKVGRSAILVDHVNALGAASKGLAGKAFGTIFKRNWVRMSYEVKRVHDSADGERHLGVYCTKRNNGPRFDAFGLAWTINDEVSSWQRETISEPELAAALPVRKRMVICLGEDSPLSMTTLAERCETKVDNIRVELSRDKTGVFRKLDNGLIELAPRLQVVNAAAEEPGDLPW